MKGSGLYIPCRSFHQMSTKKIVPMTILLLVIPMGKVCSASVWILLNQPTKLVFKWCTISLLLIPFMFQNGLIPTNTNFWQVRLERNSSKRLHSTGYFFPISIGLQYMITLHNFTEASIQIQERPYFHKFCQNWKIRKGPLCRLCGSILEHEFDGWNLAKWSRKNEFILRQTLQSFEHWPSGLQRRC